MEKEDLLRFEVAASSETQGQIIGVRTGEMYAGRSLVRAIVYKSGWNSPWEDTFNELQFKSPFAFLLLIEHKF